MTVDHDETTHIATETLEASEMTPEEDNTVAAEHVSSSSASSSSSPLANIKGLIETALFITRTPLTIFELSELVEAPELAIETALMDLMSDYSFRDESAIELDDTDGYILQVKPEYRLVVDKLMPMEVSPAAVRTLSAIAIKGPIVQSELVELRGSSVYEHIPELLEKRLISKNRKGRSYRLSVTPYFYEYFKLKGDKKDLNAMMDILDTNNGLIPIPTGRPGASYRQASTYEDLTGDASPEETATADEIGEDTQRAE